MGDLQRREFHEALLDADAFEDLPGRWQAVIVAAEQSRPDLRVVRSEFRPDQWASTAQSLLAQRSTQDDCE